MAILTPGLNNSKKISELRQRDVITYHQENSWIPLAQYNSRTGAYTNIAINIAAITSYTTAYASYWINNSQTYTNELYQPSYWVDLLKVGTVEKTDDEEENNKAIGYAISNSAIASNLITYSFTYTLNYLGWQYFLGRSQEIQTDVQYLFTELGDFLLTDDGRKIII